MTDLLIRAAMVYDGLGNPPVTQDIAVTGDVITGVGDLSSQTAAKVVDGAGLALCPGFIDIHTHSDFSLLSNPLMASSVAQGVTTELVGNCGTSIGLANQDDVFLQERRWVERGGASITWSTLGQYLQRVRDNGIAANVATLAGHGTIRKAVMGFENRPPTEAELTRMQHILDRALADGAVGVSTGLEYIPGSFSDVQEQAALVKVAAAAGGFYATHLRNEGDTLVESVQEALTVAELAGCALQLSHHKVEGRHNWGVIAKTLRMIADARDRGMDVLTDQYPYIAYMTGLAVVLLPGWAQEGSAETMIDRLKDPVQRQRVLAQVETEGRDYDGIKIGIARGRADIQGLSLRELGALDGKSPAEAGIDLLIQEEGWVAALNFAMSEDDVETILRFPFTMIGSDGVAHDPVRDNTADRTHPRSYGTFPRILGEYVRKRGVITFEEAVRRMTSLPAQRLRLTDRGVLKQGMKADLVLLHPGQITDSATFDEPHQYPAGIHSVYVNGTLAFADGESTGARAGRVLARG
jgi:N-acyl-D-amino-acid deacylase